MSDRSTAASCVTPVDDELFVYYAGYRWGHKYRRSEDRQVGLVKLRRDRHVARQSGRTKGTLTTRPLSLNVADLTLNIAAGTAKRACRSATCKTGPSTASRLLIAVQSPPIRFPRR